MKKAILGILCISCIHPIIASEQEKKSFAVHELRGYGVVGLTASPAIASDLGFGFRFQECHVGFDIVLDFSTLFTNVTSRHWPRRKQKPKIFHNFTNHIICKITPSILIYPHPNLTHERYIGLGCEIGLCEEDHVNFKFFAPELIVGKKYINSCGKKRFIELRVAFPTFFPYRTQPSQFIENHCHTIYTPLFTLKYGFLF
jgi:hypothetical protein